MSDYKLFTIVYEEDNPDEYNYGAWWTTHISKRFPTTQEAIKILYEKELNPTDMVLDEKYIYVMEQDLGQFEIIEKRG